MNPATYKRLVLNRKAQAIADKVEARKLQEAAACAYEAALACNREALANEARPCLADASGILSALALASSSLHA
jgi:hypothetical protein